MPGTLSNEAADEQALEHLRSTTPPEWLAPNPELSETVRVASEYLFSRLKPYAIKCPFDRLLTDGFDAEQIWQQIDLQTQPLLSTLRREIKKFERNPKEIRKLRSIGRGEEDETVAEEEGEKEEEKKEKDNDFDGDYGDDLDLDDIEGFEEDDDDEEEEEDGGEIKEEGNEEREGVVEDRFLKINELEKFLKEDEAREYGFKSNEKKHRKEDEEEEDDDDEEEEEDNYEELGAFDGESEEDDANARYEDFFGSAKKKVLKKKSKLEIDSSSSEEAAEGEEEEDDDDEEYGDEHDYDNDVMANNKKMDGVSTHEKQLAKIQAEIKKMEKANLDPKTWTMQGEVTAEKRPKNSALEVDLDFEHNIRPAPVITEEVTASLENMIRQRIIEGQFDDVQKARRIASKAPRELKELNENKSKKGLAEVYEDEYVKKTDLATTPMSFSDELEKEGELLWKKISLKLDALSHFHFAPKPIVENMSIQANVPALAIEEIAPVAVSDAAMLAPEEVFTGKCDIKEEAELTQAERKRRRANKKRKFKAEATKRSAKKARDNTFVNHNDGEYSTSSL